MDEKGMTLIELLLVSVVIVILVTVVAFQFKGWQTRYKVEAEVKDLYSDLMGMRMRALETNTMHFIHLDDSSDTLKKSYAIYRDNGDGVANITTDTRIVELSKDSLEYEINWTGPTPVDLEIDSRGLNRSGFCESNVNKLCMVDSDCGVADKCDDRPIWLTDSQDKVFLLEKDGGDDTTNTEIEVDYDCVVLSSTRINMGKIDDKGECIAK